MSEGLFYIRNEERDPRCLKVRNTYQCETSQGEDGVWTYSYTSWGTIYPSLDTWDAGAVVVMEVEPVSDVLPRFAVYNTGEILESDSTHAVLRYTKRSFVPIQVTNASQGVSFRLLRVAVYDERSWLRAKSLKEDGGLPSLVIDWSMMPYPRG